MRDNILLCVFLASWVAGSWLIWTVAVACNKTEESGSPWGAIALVWPIALPAAVVVFCVVRMVRASECLGHSLRFCWIHRALLGRALLGHHEL